MKIEVVLVSLCLLSLGLGAPVQIKEESKRRETTKETLELENALKRLAGENKKFFPGPGLQPVPQVDGLEDHPEDDLVASLPGRAMEQDSEEDEADETVDADENINQPDETEDNLRTEEEENEGGEDNSEEDLAKLSQFDTDEIQDKNVQPNMPDAEESLEQDTEDEEASEEGPSDFDDVSHYLQQNAYGEQQQELGDGYGPVQYGQDYPAYGDIDGDGSNEDYLVQDVMDMMEKHPELWARLLQARNMNLMEDAEAQYEDLYNQVPLQNVLSRDQQMDNAQNLQSLQSFSSYGMPEPNELYNDEETLRNVQQYEKLQDFYGDKGAHVVAKKQGYGPVVDYSQLYPNQLFDPNQQEDTEGSGDNEQPRNNVLEESSENDQMTEHSEKGNTLPVFKVPLM